LKNFAKWKGTKHAPSKALPFSGSTKQVPGSICFFVCSVYQSMLVDFLASFCVNFFFHMVDLKDCTDDVAAQPEGAGDDSL